MGMNLGLEKLTAAMVQHAKKVAKTVSGKKPNEDIKHAKRLPSRVSFYEQTITANLRFISCHKVALLMMLYSAMF